MKVDRFGGPEAWDGMDKKDTLYGGDRMRTGPNGAAKLKRLAHEEWQVGPNSEVRAPAPGGTWQLVRGWFACFRRPSPQAAAEFHTTTVWGGGGRTDYLVHVHDEGQTLVYVLGGTLTLTNANYPRDTIVVGADEVAYAAGGTNLLQKTVRLKVLVRPLVQTFLYYPGVLHVSDLGPGLLEEDDLRSSLEAFSEGNIPLALATYPTNRTATNNAERLYLGTLLLSVGNVQEARAVVVTNLATLASGAGRHERLAGAIQQVMAAAEGVEWPRTDAPSSATEWLAESYYQQSRAGQTYVTNAWEVSAYRGARNALDRALIAATNATPPGSTFEFGWVRRAELEFSFGRSKKAEAALAMAPNHQRGNAQAVALRGFLRWAANDYEGALARFREAAALDGRLGNAWLGLGLTELRQESVFEYIGRGRLLDYWRPKPDSEGLRHLEAAASVEADRSLLRSYLGKAYYDSSGWWGQDAWLVTNAVKQLDLARRLDTNDPTPHLYSALVNFQQNKVNDAIRDLEASQARNHNRMTYRSTLLLDQDRAVRSANLAAIYRDAGMTDWSVREATRAVNSDYANYSAHLFLANSFDALRDVRQVTLRYETPTVTEMLLADLLAPMGAGPLSRTISQGEYSHMFEKSRPLQLLSITDYGSGGDWQQIGSLHGTVDKTAYSLATLYRSQNGYRPNEDLQYFTFEAKIRQHATPDDSYLLQAIYTHSEGGDLRQYYDPNAASPNLRVNEEQDPLLLLGYHHQWSPASHTLFLATRLANTLQAHDSALTKSVLYRGADGSYNFDYFPPAPVPCDLPRYENEMTMYSAEVQQLFEEPRGRTILGARIQSGTFDTESVLTTDAQGEYLFWPLTFPDPLSSNAVASDTTRWSIYAYQDWDVTDTFTLSGGFCYDSLQYPINYTAPPITAQQATTEVLSPKAGFTWNLAKSTTVRGAYSQSLGGISFEQSLQLEPSQLSGFIQSFRSLIPESVAGSSPAPTFEMWGLGIEHAFHTHTYLSVEAQWLESDAVKAEGVFQSVGFESSVAEATVLNDLQYREAGVLLSVNQLLTENWSFGARYRLSDVRLQRDVRDIPLPGEAESAVLHELNLAVLYSHPCGFFSQLDALWTSQHNYDYMPDTPGDSFWHIQYSLGYRFPRRHAEIRVGLLNLTDQGYRLNPLNWSSALPQERTLLVSFKVSL